MTDEFNLPAPLDYPLDMLRDMHLQPNPAAVAAAYGYDYDKLQSQPLFVTKMAQVERALLTEGAMTPIIAGIGLHAAVEKLAYRVHDDRMTTSDLVKAIETLKKVKDGNKANEQQATAGVSLVINIPAFGDHAKQTIEVTAVTKEPITIESDLEDDDDPDTNPNALQTFTIDDFDLSTLEPYRPE